MQELRTHLAADLDTPGALAVVDTWAGAARGETEDGACELVRDALDALLGVQV